MPIIDAFHDGSMQAAADYSTTASLYRFVRISGNRQVTLGVTTTGDPAYGILQNLPETNQACKIATMGTSLLQLGSGGAGSAGTKLRSDTNGRGVAVAANGDVAMAIARESGASGEQISVFIIPGGDKGQFA